jgi:hypothetical protein
MADSLNEQSKGECVLVGQAVNTSSEMGRRIEGSIGAAVIGALCGAMLAAFAAAVSASVLSMAITIAAASFLGGQVRGHQGLVGGLLMGILIVVLGSVFGGSGFGVAAAIAGGASVGACTEWHRRPEADLNRDWSYTIPARHTSRFRDGDDSLSDGDLDGVFPRAHPLENPQIARWQFLRWTGREERRANLPSEERSERAADHRRQGT